MMSEIVCLGYLSEPPRGENQKSNLFSAVAVLAILVESFVRVDGDSREKTALPDSTCRCQTARLFVFDDNQS
jgi:hypothetical protein